MIVMEKKSSELVDRAKGEDQSTAAVDDEGLKENICLYDFPTIYRYVLMVTVTIMAIFVGPTFMNWPPFRTMITATSCNEALCNEDSKEYEVLGPEFNNRVTCVARKVAIEGIQNLNVSMMFTFTFVAGILLDTVGAKIGSMLGVASQIIGWLILGLSAKFEFEGYRIGFVLIAIGTDPTYFGLLSISNLFPSNSSTMMAILGAARSAAYFVPLIMQMIFKAGLDFSSICFIYIFVVLFWFLWVVFVLPYRPFPKTTILHTNPGEGIPSMKEYVRERPKGSWEATKEGTKTQVTEYWQYASTLGYIVILPLPAVALLSNNFYTNMQEHHIPDSIDLFTIMNPLSFIPCPFLGFLADRVSATMTIFVVQTCGALMFVFGLMHSGKATEVISIMFYWVFASFIASEFYIYIFSKLLIYLKLTTAIYPQRQVGKLSGIMLLIGGLMSLLATPMYDAVKEKNIGVPLDIVVIVLHLCAASVAVYLFFAVERPHLRRRKQQVEERAAREAFQLSDAQKYVEP